MRNVLIITRRFPPKNHIAARRFGFMAPYMEEFGWRPWIVTQPSSGDLPVRIPGSQILRIAPPPKAGDDGTFRCRVLHRTPYRLRAFVESWYWPVMAQRRAVDALPRPDAIVASHGPVSALWLGRYYAARYRVPWIADFQDLMALRCRSGNRLGNLLDACAERLVLRSSAGITTPGLHWSELLQEAYRKPAEAVYLGYGFTPEDLDAVGSAGPPELKRGPCIHYGGRLYEHQLDGVDALLDALCAAPGVSLVLRLLGRSVSADAVRHRAEDRNLQGRVHVLPPCGAVTALMEANTAFCNLVVEDLGAGQNWRRGTVTGKFLELLPLRPPILAVARGDSDIGPILERTRKGRLCSDATQIASFLQEVASSATAYVGDPGEIARFSMRSQARVFCRFLDRVAAVPQIGMAPEISS